MSISCSSGKVCVPLATQLQLRLPSCFPHTQGFCLFHPGLARLYFLYPSPLSGREGCLNIDLWQQVRHVLEITPGSTLHVYHARNSGGSVGQEGTDSRQPSVKKTGHSNLVVPQEAVSVSDLAVLQPILDKQKPLRNASCQQLLAQNSGVMTSPTMRGYDPQPIGNLNGALWQSNPCIGDMLLIATVLRDPSSFEVLSPIPAATITLELARCGRCHTKSCHTIFKEG